MKRPTTLYLLFKKCGNSSCHACTQPGMKYARKASKSLMLGFLKEWRAEFNKTGGMMRPKDVIDMMLGRPLEQENDEEKL